MLRPELCIETSPLNAAGATLMRLKGSLDANTYDAFENALLCVYSKGSFEIAVDLSDVEYMASAGIGVLIGALSRTHENRGNICLMNPRPGVQSVLELLGLRDFFSIVADRTAAVALFTH